MHIYIFVSKVAYFWPIVAPPPVQDVSLWLRQIHPPPLLPPLLLLNCEYEFVGGKLSDLGWSYHIFCYTNPISVTFIICRHLSHIFRYCRNLTERQELLVGEAPVLGWFYFVFQWVHLLYISVVHQGRLLSIDILINCRGYCHWALLITGNKL